MREGIKERRNGRYGTETGVDWSWAFWALMKGRKLHVWSSNSLAQKRKVTQLEYGPYTREYITFDATSTVERPGAAAWGQPLTFFENNPHTRRTRALPRRLRAHLSTSLGK